MMDSKSWGQLKSARPTICAEFARFHVKVAIKYSRTNAVEKPTHSCQFNLQSRFSRDTLS
jgi:hypothetical protein